jgi:hypothetical protein
MLDSTQIEELERAMLAEHHKDLEALTRLKRFLPANGAAKAVATQPPIPVAPLAARVATVEDAKSLRTRVAEVMSANPESQWTAQSMLAKLLTTDFKTEAKNPIPSVQLVMARWEKLGKAVLVRKGTGRIANKYAWAAGATVANEGKD